MCSAFYHGTEVASDRVMRRLTPRSVVACERRFAASGRTRRAYLHYFIDYHKRTAPEIGKLSIDDLRESRIVVVDPAPIPAEELQRTYEWVRSWGMLDMTVSPLTLVDQNIQAHAHQTA